MINVVVHCHRPTSHIFSKISMVKSYDATTNYFSFKSNIPSIVLKTHFVCQEA